MAMKIPLKKPREARKGDDDSLFGLLSSYKSYNTYISLFFSETENSVIVFVTDNPKKWSLMTDEKYAAFRPLKRLEAGLPRLSVKYMLPEHLIKSIGPMLGMKLPTNRVTIINNIDSDGYFILETSSKFLPEVIQNMKKIITMPPQKKYEMLEKCLAENA